MAPVGAQLVKAANRPAAADMSVDSYAFGSSNRRAKQQSLSDLQPLDSVDDSHSRRSSAAPSTSRHATIQSRDSSHASLIDDIDDYLPDLPEPALLHRQYARQYDDQSALFGERDPSMSEHVRQLDSEPIDATSARESAARALFSSASQRYSLPSTYPSSIASSWSRPERSVWFQQKAIIITSIFLAIFIVLFIGAAVFLRERKFDDQLAGLDDEEALARIEERMAIGRFSDPTEKDSGMPGARLKRRLGIGKNPSQKDGGDQHSDDPSSGSSSAVKRHRHLVSRWTRSNLRGSNETARGTSDGASIPSSRSPRRLALGDPRAQEESVEITYNSDGAEISRVVNGQTGDSASRGREASSARTDGSTTLNDGSPTSDLLANRPRSPPPPHPDSGTQRHADPSSSEGRSSSSPDTQGGNSSSNIVEPRSPRRVLLDDSDFQAADAHDDMRHMPPAYIPSGSGGVSSSNYDGAALAAVLSRGDAKNGIPPPEERDATVPTEVINAVLANSHPAALEDESTSGPTAAHIATDDKAVLAALSATASMPSAPGAVANAAAPAYGEDAGASGSGGGAPSGPSAPALAVDDDGFQVPSAADVADVSSAGGKLTEKVAAGKGKAKQEHSLLPAPPTAVEAAFSPFDQPYRLSAAPPRGASVPKSAPTARKSEKQKEAEEEQLANLVASQPAVGVPVYERVDASAPPLLGEGEEEQEERRVGEGLPAYERKTAQASAPIAPAEDADAPSAPSAPPADDHEEENDRQR
ncbi:uncharacterized protein UHOD_08148 [Ustilago sp. UG-2017b]|nr:uncharacterized protein UHOD_08148 [Ustilago sp. UG-2017b]